VCEGKVAIVTGSTKGIGHAIAKALVQRGASVIITSRSLLSAQEAAKALQTLTITASQRVMGCEYNIEDQTNHRNLIKFAVDNFATLDILVNNAISQNCTAPLEVLTDEQILTAITTNIGNTLLLTRAAYPLLKDSLGVVLNIGSVIVNRHLQDLALYAIVKGAIQQMTKALASDWAADKIRVNAINPGFIRTAAFADMGMPNEIIDKSYEFYKSYCPLGAVGEPSQLETLAAFLVSDQARFITGSSMDVDGGYSVKSLPLFQIDN